jgi:hypothetical protein
MNLQTEIVASERIVLLTHNNIEEARQRNIVLGREVFKVETGEKIGVTEEIMDGSNRIRLDESTLQLVVYMEEDFKEADSKKE